MHENRALKENVRTAQQRIEALHMELAVATSGSTVADGEKDDLPEWKSGSIAPREGVKREGVKREGVEREMAEREVGESEALERLREQHATEMKILEFRFEQETQAKAFQARELRIQIQVGYYSCTCLFVYLFDYFF